MNEKTKNILSWVLSILFVGGIITILFVNPCIFLYIIGAVGLLFLFGAMVYVVKTVLYDVISKACSQEQYRKYISKHYESREQLFRERGNEICAWCDKDCVVKYPSRIYDKSQANCTKSADVFIEECGLKIDEDHKGQV